MPAELRPVSDPLHHQASGLEGRLVLSPRLRVQSHSKNIAGLQLLDFGEDPRVPHLPPKLRPHGSRPVRQLPSTDGHADGCTSQSLVRPRPTRVGAEHGLGDKNSIYKRPPPRAQNSAKVRPGKECDLCESFAPVRGLQLPQIREQRCRKVHPGQLRPADQPDSQRNAGA